MAKCKQCCVITFVSDLQYVGGCIEVHMFLFFPTDHHDLTKVFQKWRIQGLRCYGRMAVGCTSIHPSNYPFNHSINICEL